MRLLKQKLTADNIHSISKISHLKYITAVSIPIEVCAQL